MKALVADTIRIGPDGPRMTNGPYYPTIPPGVYGELGSYYVCTADGTWWQKVVGGDTEWCQLRTIGAANGGDVDMVRGAPVTYAGDQVVLASAISFGLSVVTGIIVVGAAPTLVVQFVPIGLTIMQTSDWDAVTGQTGGLTPAASYYLDVTPGRLTTTPPSNDGHVLVKIGHAVSAFGLLIQPQPPILL